MRNSEANSKKKSTKVVWRAGKVTKSLQGRDPGAVVGIVGSVGGGGDPESKLRRLVERQHAASVQLQVCCWRACLCLSKTERTNQKEKAEGASRAIAVSSTQSKEQMYSAFQNNYVHTVP